ncbi:serC [Symbiodinium necroappetens]|uniref:Phosphoserine aminotransferase n=1 Tax=Symbiodinium necroappetens TaxID=1628268 RepID=A0A812KVG7_9DINO|nr:serC [Symbiodinium necroappetens]
MSDRCYNFSAGPAALPEPVLKQAQKDLWNFDGSGMGVCELSHRGKEYDRILEEAIADCREVGNVPDDWHVLFMQGGATMQFACMPANFSGEGKTTDYIDTGEWARKAMEEAQRFPGTVNCAFSGQGENYNRLPKDSELKTTEGAAYLQFCSNNTIMGTEFKRVPKAAAGVPIIRDASSDMYSRPIDFSELDMIYASAQKNLGPSGCALVLIKDSFLQKSDDKHIATMMSYKVMQKKESRPNTPNTFAVYLMGQVFKWIKAEGGLKAIEKYNEEKIAPLYDFIDGSDFFIPHAVTEDRSIMNASFRTPNEELDKLFIKQAEAKGLKTLAGHRSIGGMRASVYNAFPAKGITALVDFMKQFEHENAGKTTVSA